jgi:hypothetical protein
MGNGLKSALHPVASDFENPVHVDPGSWLILADFDLEKITPGGPVPMNDHPATETHPAAASEISEPRTRIPRAAHARALLHEPEIDPSFVAMLQEALPDEEARLAYLNHLAWSTRT